MWVEQALQRRRARTVSARSSIQGPSSQQPEADDPLLGRGGHEPAASAEAKDGRLRRRLTGGPSVPGRFDP